MVKSFTLLHFLLFFFTFYSSKDAKKGFTVFTKKHKAAQTFFNNDEQKVIRVKMQKILALITGINYIITDFQNDQVLNVGLVSKR